MSESNIRLRLSLAPESSFTDELGKPKKSDIKLMRSWFAAPFKGGEVTFTCNRLRHSLIPEISVLEDEG
jgi:hypothetical protein